MKQKPITTACRFILLASVFALTGLANAGIIVTRGHVVGGSATGTLVAIDTPHISNASSTATIGGPTWTTAGVITAHQADQGFAALSTASGIREFDSGGTPWEPDGTPFSQARGYMMYTNGSPATTWTFNLAASGVDLPDGTIIHGVYARFGNRNNDKALYEFTEGSSSGNLTLNQVAASTGDIVLRWFDSDSNPRNSNFQRIFNGPITVTGGNGFQLKVSDSSGNAAHIDSIVLDTSLPKANDIPAISTLLPADNKTSVVTWNPLEVTFDEPVALTGTGTVTITDLTDGSSTRVINLPDPQVTSPNGDDLLITPSPKLEYGTQYSVKISADALVDLASTPNAFPGILDDTAWNFTTRAMPNQLHNVLIVTAALSDAQPNATGARTADVLFNEPRNVDENMRVSSYGQIGLNLGDNSGLPGIVELSYPTLTVATSGGSSSLKNRMATSLAAMGYNLALSNFRFILYVQPAALNTGNDGWANLNSNTSVYLATFNMHLAMHEMGHCLGGNHSQGNNPGCSLGAYQVDNDYDASKKILFGWLNAFPGTVSNIPANTGTTQMLVPLSRNPAILSGMRAIRIPNPNGGTSNFVLSYRINDGTYNTLLNSSYSQKVFVVEDFGGALTTYKTALGSGQQYTNGKFKVTCNSVAGDGLSAAVTVTINTAPVAVAQSGTTNEDTALPIVLTGTDADSNPLSYTVVSQPANGILSGTAPNVTYSPNANYNGVDSFTFKVNDGIVDSTIATVSINVNSVNDLPIAVSQSLTTAEDTALPITLSGNDVETGTLTYTILTPPANGSLTGTAPNLTYTSSAEFNGADGFTFVVNDGTVDSAVTTVAITVTPVNDTPVAVAQSVSVSEDNALPVVLSGMDVDPDVLNFTIVSQPVNGTLSGTAPNLTFSPSTNFNGTDSLTFIVNDGTVDSAVATVAITVTSINDVPDAIAQSVSTDEDTALPITLAGTDVENSTLSYTIVTPPANGTLSGTAPDLTYTPTAEFNGADSFTFIVNDGTIDSATATVSLTVTPVSDAPVAVAQSLTTGEDTSLSITLTGTDADQETLSYVIISQPANGTLNGTAPNLTFTPTANFNGPDSFTFMVNDGTTDSAVATISITVTPVNDAPVAAAQNVTTEESTSLPITLTGTDLDLDTLTYTIVTPPANGTLSGTAPNVTYAPTGFYSGPDSFTFTVSDGTADSVTATVSITVNPVNTLSWDSNGAAANHSDGGGAWLNANQWRNAGVNVGWTSGLAAIFGNGGVGGAVTLASPTTVSSLTLNPHTGTYTLGTAGNAITLNKGITKNSGSGTASVISPVILAGPQTWTNNSTNALSLTAGLNNGGHTLTFTGSGNVSLNATNNVITGSGGITMNGSGRLTLGANPAPAHTYSGTTTINGGSVLMHNNLGTGNLTIQSGYLDFYYGGTFTRPLGSGNGQVSISSGTSGFSSNGSTGVTLRLNNSSAYEVVWGSAHFNPSTLILQAATAQNSSSLTFDNKIDLNGVTRTISTSITTGTGAGAGSATLSQIIRNSTGTAGLIKTGSGRLNLNAANTYNGGTTIQSGTLQLGNVSALGSASGPLTVNGGLLNLNDQTVSIGNLTGTGGTIANNASGVRTLTIGSGNATGGVYQGVIANKTGTGTGSVALAKTGSGAITLANSNTYTGATSINGGTLILTGATQATASITTSASGSLGLVIGLPVTATSAAVNLANGTVSVTGTPTAPSHVLLTAASITGIPVLANPISDYELVIVGNQLLLNSTVSAGSPAPMLAADAGGGTGDSTTIMATEAPVNETPVSTTDPITVTDLPLPWTSGDIGTGMLAGSAMFNAGSFTQDGSGVIGSTADKLRFTYQMLTGDGEIIAKISALQITGNSSRVGVMIRDTLASNSKQIFMGLTGSNAYRWDSRTATGGSTTSSNSSTGTVPNTWVRLVRSGTTITAYKSTNGTTWSFVGSATSTTFASTCYIGLAVGSGSDTTLNTSSFSNVLVNP